VRRCLAVLAVMLTCSTTASADSLCTPSEHAWFDAALADGSGRLLSICGSPPPVDGTAAEEARAWLQFRLGKPGNLETAFPAERKNSTAAFTYRRYTRPRTTYLSLRFETAGKRYSPQEDVLADDQPPHRLRLEFREPAASTEPTAIPLHGPADPLQLMRLEAILPNAQ
jgi:hypothetical protein